MANGNNAVMQVGIEDTAYGTAPATMEKQVRFSSEGFKYVPDKKEEGLLTGNRATGASYIMGQKVEGSFSTNVRPDEAGYWLALGLGEEDTPTLESGASGAYLHTFTAVGATLSDSLPSAAFCIDRVVDVFEYAGMKVSDFSFSASPGDYLKIDVNLVGKTETGSQTLDSLTASTLKPFRFSQGVVKIDDTTVADVTSIKFDYNNNLESDIQTTSTGSYYKEPEAGARSLTMELEVLYTSDTDAYRTSYLKTDTNFSVDLIFTSDEEIETDFPYSLSISVPHAQMLNSEANVSGADRLRQSLSLQAIEVSPDEFVAVDLVNGDETAYI